MSFHIFLINKIANINKNLIRKLANYWGNSFMGPTLCRIEVGPRLEWRRVTSGIASGWDQVWQHARGVGAKGISISRHVLGMFEGGRLRLLPCLIGLSMVALVTIVGKLSHGFVT